MIHLPTGVERTSYLVNAIGLALLTLLGAVVWEGGAEHLAIAAPVLLAVVLIMVAAPGAGVAAAVAATPTMYQLHPLPRGQFSLLELAILALVAAVGLRTAWSLFARRDLRPIRAFADPPQIAVPVVLILLASLIALAMVADPSRRDISLREVRTVIVEPILFLGATKIVFANPVHRSFAAMTLVVAGAVVGVHAGLQVILEFGGVRAGSVLRATGPYSHPNNLSFFLERTSVLSLAVAIARPRWWPAWLLALIQLGGLGLTWSRGALLAFAFGVAVLLLVRGMYRWLAGLGVAGVAAVLAAWAISPDRLIDVGGSGSEPTRFTIWRASFRMASDHPIFGVGPDQFLYQYWRRYVEPRGWPERYTSHPHNLPLDIWLRLGISGLAAFGTLLVGVAWTVRRGWTRIRQEIWATGALAALATGLLHGMVDNGFFLPDLATLTWFLIALIGTVPGIPAGEGAG